MRTFLNLAALLAIGLSIAACKPDVQATAAQKAEQSNIAAQQDVKARATAAVSVPPITNFQARENLAEFMRRVDEKGKVWYVYERARNTGDILGFYLSSSYPQSVCTFMTPPEELKKTRIDAGPHYADAISIVTAIALDGVYYKGGDCPDFFFDYTSGAMIVLDADSLTTAVDRPLNVAAPKWTFAKAQDAPKPSPAE